MSVSDPFKAFVADHFSALGMVSARNMFGGAGVYAQGVMFALLADDVLYVKADADMVTELAELGCHAFTVDFGKGKGSHSMGYWTLPESAMDDPFEAEQWGRRALAFALSKKKKK
jgi:DNA transformation protein